MENKVLGNWSLFGRLIGSGIVIITIISALVSACFAPVFHLNENQLLNLFSSMAQILGGLFGLTLTAYVFFVDKFKESAKEDEIYYDATATILKRFFHTLIMIAFTCGVTISFCIIGTISLHNWSLVYPFIINESILLFMLGIVSTLVFGIMLLDPEKLDKEISKMKKQAEAYYQSNASAKAGDFREFLRTYNQLETIIIDFAKNLVYNQQQYYRNYKPQIIQSLKVLGGNEVINGALMTEINELRMYRNGLVHGVDFNVSQDACNRISTIYAVLKNAYNVFEKNGKGSSEWTEAIRKIYDLTC